MWKTNNTRGIFRRTMPFSQMVSREKGDLFKIYKPVECWIINSNGIRTNASYRERKKNMKENGTDCSSISISISSDKPIEKASTWKHCYDGVCNVHGLFFSAYFIKIFAAFLWIVCYFFLFFFTFFAIEWVLFSAICVHINNIYY